MTTESVKERYDYIIKSENDDRSYRGLKLANEMKVLLISDPTIDRGAAALDVHIGSTADPNHISGLAHLLQHVLYLTEVKETPQRAFKVYLMQNNGEINAKTSEDHTNYQFDIPVTKFKDALTRFAEFFIKPFVFTENLIYPELYNLNHEQLGSEDKWKLTGLFKWIIDRNHSISRNGICQPVTYEDIVNNLQKFYDHHYSSHIMSLCVLSKESLNELEKLVVDLFSQVKATDSTNTRYMEMQYWRAPEFTSVYKIWGAPYEDYKRLYIIFPTEQFSHYQYTTALQHFLAYLFEYAGKGSLTSVLKTKGWGNSIEASGLRACKFFSFFVVAADLTDEGLEHLDDIMTLFIQYVKMLQKNDSELRRIYNEYKEIMELKFRFKEKESSLKYLSIISRTLQYTTDMKDVLRLEYIIPTVNFGPIIKSIIDNFLSPLRMKIYMIAEKYKNLTHELVPFYRYRYREEMASAKTCANWWNNPCAVLNLPACNEFLPTMINVKPCEDNAEKFPTVIWDTQFVRLWHKKDDVFNKPRATMIFHFICPSAYANSVNANLTLLFVRLVNNSLSEYLYPAALVDLQWELSATVYGILLKISGFDDKQYILLKKIVDRMINFQLSPENFEVDRQNHIQHCKKQLKQFEESQPYRQAQYYLSILLNKYLISKVEILKASTSITFERVQQFISDLFNSVYVECLIHGNMTRAEALNVAQLIENKLSHVTPLTITHLEMHHGVKGVKSGLLPFLKRNEFHKSSCTQVFYQINERSTQSDVLLDLVQQIINEPCFNTLKTEKNLGYIVCTGIHRENRIQGLIILVQSTKVQFHEVVEAEIQKFINFILEDIKNMPEENFQKSKTLLAKLYDDKKPKTLNDLSSAFWVEILNQQYNFDRTNVEVDYLDKITKEDLHNFFKKLMGFHSTKLSVYVRHPHTPLPSYKKTSQKK
ncbi:unnamed protein product [Lasius platythorax]|uniref:Insulin-degrading enzyme n=1 Tax=Lasius platythorax TaxID=488582 RepID=A0AAV2P3S1_9HYME